MPRCELCGEKEDSLTTAKVSSAEMDVCSSCTDYGTVVEENNSETDSSTKYDTESTTTSRSDAQTSSQNNPSYSDSTEEFSSLPPDYGDRVQEARESAGLSRSDLASELKEKESLIRRIENNQTQPTTELQKKLERTLQVELDSETSSEEFDDDNPSNNLTIGDIVERN